MQSSPLRLLKPFSRCCSMLVSSSKRAKKPFTLSACTEYLDSVYSLKLNRATSTAEGGSELLMLPVNTVAAQGDGAEATTTHAMSSMTRARMRRELSQAVKNAILERIQTEAIARRATVQLPFESDAGAAAVCTRDSGPRATGGWRRLGDGISVSTFKFKPKSGG